MVCAMKSNIIKIFGMLIIIVLLCIFMSNNQRPFIPAVKKQPDIEEIFPPPLQYYKNLAEYDGSHRVELVPFKEYR